VLHHDPELGQSLQQGLQHVIDEGFFPVKDVDLRLGNFTMNQQKYAFLGHGVQRRLDVADIGDPGIGIRGGAGRVELAGNDSLRGGLPDHRWLGGVIRQV